MSACKALSALELAVGLLTEEPRGSLARRMRPLKVIAWGPLKPPPFLLGRLSVVFCVFVYHQ